MKLLPEQNSFETNDFNGKKLPPIFTVKKKRYPEYFPLFTLSLFLLLVVAEAEAVVLWPSS